ANIDVSGVCTHRETCDHAAFDQRMRIVAQNFAVLTGAWFGFVSIDDEVMRTAIVFLRHEGPLQASREACATTSTKTRSLHLVDDPVAATLNNNLGAVPMTACHSALKALVLEAVEIGKDAILIF